MATPLTVPRQERGTAQRGSRSKLWKLSLLLVAILGVCGAVYFSGTSQSVIKRTLKSLSAGEARSEPTPSGTAPWKPRATSLGADLVTVTAEEEDAIGFNLAPVKAQTEPILIELTGRTAYDDNTISKVRPRFDTRVEFVHASIGQKVKKGDPLVELYSTDLAKAKTDCQTKYVQWQHDKNLYNLRKPLAASGAIAQQLWVDTQNDELKSRLDYNVALDYLEVFYEVPKAQIDPLLDKLGEKVVDPRSFGEVGDKAKITLRSKVDGYVITRAVVPGNYYESTDVLLEIAPLDHLWVWVNVYELDQDKVRVDQKLQIQFPFLQQKITGKVDYVASEVSKDTRAVKIRATIPNPEARLKSDMLVKAMLEIPPVKGQTVIPRQAMVAISGGEYVFIREPQSPSPNKSEPSKTAPGDRFRRIRIQVAQESTYNVVVAQGLVPDQVVVTNGSLILSQLYEDQRMTTTAMPVQ
jgi:cobalt-zinc-cadmium efflux system membrane fusion protein